jgi:hypothetical protein
MPDQCHYPAAGKLAEPRRMFTNEGGREADRVQDDRFVHDV